MAFRTRDHAYNENWDKARQNRDRLEEKLRNLLPNWPDIQDIIDKIPMGSTLQAIGTPTVDGVFVQVLGGGSSSGGTTASGGASALVPIPISTTEYAFSGTATFPRGNDVIQAPMSATLNIGLHQAGLAVTGRVYSGSVTLDFGQGVNASLDIINEAGNTVTTDVNGTGWLTARLTFSHSLPSWDAILPSEIRIRFPIMVDQGGVITLDSTLADRSEYFIRRARGYTDYNVDGVYDLPSDLAAFLTAHDAHDPSADIDANGVWDQSDIDIWLADFDEDAAHYGN